MITLAMICRDNAATLPRLLESVAATKAVDNFVAVDTGSTDATVSILESWGVQVGHYTWDDHYARARNAALDLVPEGSWVLSLDSDEWLGNDFGPRLREATAALDQNGHPEDGITIYIRSHMDNNGYANVMPIYAPRVFKNLPGTRWVFRVHEQTWRASQAINFHQHPGLVVEHDGYLRANFDAAKKQERNTRLLKLAIEEEPGEAWHRYNYGESLYGEHKIPEAVEQLEEAVRLSVLNGFEDRYMCITAKMRLVGCWPAVGKLPEALVLGKEMEARHPQYAEALCAYGVALAANGQFYEAADKYEKAVQIGQKIKSGEFIYPYSGDEAIRTWLGCIYQARCLIHAREYVRAIECYNDSIALNAPVLDPKIESAACYAMVGRKDLALDHLSKLPATDVRVASLVSQLNSEAQDLQIPIELGVK